MRGVSVTIKMNRPAQSHVLLSVCVTCCHDDRMGQPIQQTDEHGVQSRRDLIFIGKASFGLSKHQIDLKVILKTFLSKLIIKE